MSRNHSIRHIAFTLALCLTGLASTPSLAKPCIAGQPCSIAPSFGPCNVPSLGGNETDGGCMSQCLQPNIPNSCYSGGSVNTGCVYSWIASQCLNDALATGYLYGIAGPLTAEPECSGTTGYFASCTFSNSTGSAQNCTTPWGATLASGQNVPAYSEAAGNPACPAVNTLSCNNGSLICSGGAVNPNCKYESCSAPQPSVCMTPWGATLAGGNSVPAYIVGSVIAPASCPSANTLTCNSTGQLAGALSCSGGAVNPNCEYASCTVAASCTTPWLTQLASGSSVKAYNESIGSPSCSAANTLTCNNGALSCSGGAVNPNCEYQNCTVALSCTTPWLTQIASGSSVNAYSQNVGTPSCAAANTLSCYNGTLSCSGGAVSNCEYQNCTAAASCATPWGTTIASGQSVTAYQAANVTAPAACTGQTRTCANGVLSGSYQYQSCNVTQPASCTTPWGSTLASGSSVSAYSEGTGNPTCTAANTLSCSNGTLYCSGGAGECNYQSCSPNFVPCQQCVNSYLAQSESNDPNCTPKLAQYYTGWTVYTSYNSPNCVPWDAGIKAAFELGCSAQGYNCVTNISWAGASSSCYLPTSSKINGGFGPINYSCGIKGGS